MPKSVSGRQMIGIGEAGSRVDIDTRGIDRLTVGVPAHTLMSTGVLELKIVMRGLLVSFDTPQTITSSVPAIVGLDVDGIESVALVPTTVLAGGPDLLAEWYGEETI